MLGLSLKAGSPRAAAHPANLADLLNPIASELVRVEEMLSEQVRGFNLGVSDYVDYVLSGSGKRLRPSLSLLSGGVTGRVGDDHILLGVIVELIHIATLVHDDVLDEAEMRHGLPTSNARWGNEISVLLGDCLFAHALKLAASFPTTEVCRGVSDSTNIVCSGEILQTLKRFDVAMSLEQYLEIIRMKTGALFAVSCELGARLNAARPAVVQTLGQFGENLGIAYQLYDDCIDLFGQEARAGKSLGTDVEKGKLTLPLLLLLGRLGEQERQDLGAMISRSDPEERPRLLSLVAADGIVKESRALIDDYIRRAAAGLQELPPSRYGRTLSGLLDYVSDQSRMLLQRTQAA